MGQYTNKGLYNGYDKNNKEREALDYYATPPEEVQNILETIGLNDLDKSIILDPCCGGGHMIEGILRAVPDGAVTGTDIMKRDNPFIENHKTVDYYYGKEFDFLSEDYPVKGVDYVVLNPPFSCIIPFTLHSLEIARKGVIMLARLQFIETSSRYEKIFKDFPPTEVYVYVDRIACYKNGDFTKKQQSAQAYAWFYWNTDKIGDETKLKFIRRR